MLRYGLIVAWEGSLLGGRLVVSGGWFALRCQTLIGMSLCFLASLSFFPMLLVKVLD